MLVNHFAETVKYFDLLSDTKDDTASEKRGANSTVLLRLFRNVTGWKDYSDVAVRIVEELHEMLHLAPAQTTSIVKNVSARTVNIAA